MGQILSTGWSLEQSDFLKELVLSGLSYARSAAAINEKFNTNYSRNAAIGRANRIGLSAPPAPTMPKKKRVYIYKPRIQKPKREPVLNPEVIELRCAEIIPRGLALLELGPDDCRYPYGDENFTFCGFQKMLGSSYCRDHFHLTRRADTPKKILVAA